MARKKTAKKKKTKRRRRRRRLARHGHATVIKYRYQCFEATGPCDRSNRSPSQSCFQGARLFGTKQRLNPIGVPTLNTQPIVAVPMPHPHPRGATPVDALPALYYLPQWRRRGITPWDIDNAEYWVRNASKWDVAGSWRARVVRRSSGQRCAAVHKGEGRAMVLVDTGVRLCGVDDDTLWAALLNSARTAVRLMRATCETSVRLIVQVLEKVMISR